MEPETPLAPLVARLYGAKMGDYQLVSGWWNERLGKPLSETVLPPIGVIVETEGGEALVAIWCYECFGIGVCFIEYPIARPGLSIAEVKRAFSMAIDACIALAKDHGDFSIFRVYADPRVSLVLPSLGFIECMPQQMTGFLLRR